jgi:hypothetical protein
MFKKGTLRVWHIPQVPGKPFRFEVPDLESAVLLMDALAKYDMFQYENNVKPDYCNAQGLEVYHPIFEENGDGWGEWHCHEGNDLDEHIRIGSDPSELIWEMENQ